jgi:hypothetical protein
MVESAVTYITQGLAEAFRQRERWQNIKLATDEKLAFADAAIALRFDRRFTVEPEEILRPRRTQQADSSLWSVYNSAQENIMRGGIKQKREDGTTFRTRAIQSVDAEIDINQALWQLAANLETAMAAPTTGSTGHAIQTATCARQSSEHHLWGYKHDTEQ